MYSLTLFITVGLSASAAGADAAPFYADKLDLLFYLDASGERRPVQSAADWELRREHVRANFQKVAGPLPPRENLLPLDIQVEEEQEFPKYVRRKITFAVESWDRLPACLLLPKGREGKVPAVLCLHPTSEFGKDVVLGVNGKANRQYAAELAEQGFVTLAPDYPGFGDYKDARQRAYSRGYTSMTMKGIWNHMRCVDLLQSLPEVDPERIGCIGHSLGGHNTLFVGLFDERIKVMVTSCGFTLFAKYMGGDLTGWTHDGYMPAIASEFDKEPAKMPFDFPDILGALAPRTVFINAPINDDNFDNSGVRDCVEAARPIFRLYGAEDHLIAVYPEAEHDFPDLERTQAYACIRSVLERD
ncbi:MAG TPA: alpha/beta fold hydrolase [Candidatus Hydrogenedentes bacterium]|nr:alpha/beta fold hydrolase [Candidatus Hydrogenedentota bacterium]HQM50994.1 alpha/beta fold hydrolase [Candidatus Hydrogenedentota bacterium]